MSKQKGGNMTVNYQGLLPNTESDIFVQYAQFHSATSGTDFEITLIDSGDSIVSVGNIMYYMGAIGKDEWNLDLPPFVIALCAHWQALINSMPF